MVSWLLQNFELELDRFEKINGMADGIGYPETARMYPHLFKGEGQFVAKFRYLGENRAAKLPSKKDQLTAEQKKLWQDFAKKHLFITLDGVLETFGEELYLVPKGLPDLRKIKIARNGLHLGTFKKNRFEPSFALGLALRPSEVKTTVSITPDDFVHYVAGETIQLEENHPNGWYQVLVEGNGLGFAKVTGQTLKNFYPKGLRFR